MKLSIAVRASLLSLATMAAASTLNQVKTDIIAIDVSVNNLYKQCQVQSLNYFSGIAIREAADDLTNKIKAGAESARQLQETPTDKDAELMIWTLSKTESKVSLVVDQFIKLKPHFQQLGVLSIAASSVTAFQGETKSFADQLVKLAPAHEQSAALKLADNFNADLKRCNDAYNAPAAASPGVQATPVSSGAQQAGTNYAGGAGAGKAGASTNPHGLVKRKGGLGSKHR
ncbi:hypothetical protein EX895_004746 [Sporisorium graminicola]|uniref:Cell wall protein n=1 Tax=Sporisorium graminicola TaxID=280036 RepID=A0A4U7KNK0_9BASI|nr:hypothetical protein EX895_004746 [Sporisorium graminicola]TKY85921.1 hypothetical protein EX895_004746 [Sporisorium graminicola]